MDGFFEKYGRVIIIAVAICFVLLYLTPMRNVVGSSINGFAGNFANKVGESLGTVKMPDGSGGATNSEEVKAGDTLDIEGSKYIVIKRNESGQLLVMTANNIERDEFINELRSDGQNYNTYENSTIDKYLENEWYNSLSSTMKVAIQTTNIKQASYKMPKDPDSKQETGYNGQVYNTISRHVFLPSVSEIGDIVDLNNENKINRFVNGANTKIWTRDSYQKENYSVMSMMSYYYNGKLCGVLSYTSASYVVGRSIYMRPAFAIDLSKVDYKVAGHTDYK